MTTSYLKMAVGLGALALIAVAPAQMNLTSRASTQNYNYLYGGGPDAIQDTYLNTAGGLLATDTMEKHFAQQGEGWYPPANIHWIAGVSVDLYQTYAITGPLGNASSISGSGYTNVSSFIEEDGLALMRSSSPGNELVAEFSLTAATDYRLNGLFETTDGTNLPGQVALQRFDGIVWQYVHTSLFLPGSESAFDWSGTTGPGNYRLLAQIQQGTFGDESRMGAYQYNLTMGAVPEPATMAVLGLGVAALLRKRRR